MLVCKVLEGVMMLGVYYELWNLSVGLESLTVLIMGAILNLSLVAMISRFFCLLVKLLMMLVCDEMLVSFYAKLSNYNFTLLY